MKYARQEKRLLCILLVLLFAFAALVTHSHEAVGDSCAVCLFRRIVSSALLVFVGTFLLDAAASRHEAARCVPLAETRATLVSMKVKLSN